MEAEGQTDMTKLTAALRNFANGPKNINGQLHVPASLTPRKVHTVPIIKQIRDGKVKGKYQHCTVLDLNPDRAISKYCYRSMSKFELEIPQLRQHGESICVCACVTELQ
jgi:hypothetical protein